MKDGENSERFSLDVNKDGILYHGIQKFKKNSTNKIKSSNNEELNGNSQTEKVLNSRDYEEILFRFP